MLSSVGPAGKAVATVAGTTPACKPRASAVATPATAAVNHRVELLRDIYPHLPSMEHPPN
ncbi:hypothetical protein GCM10027039_27400 [Terrabacter koreensis]